MFLKDIENELGNPDSKELKELEKLKLELQQYEKHYRKSHQDYDLFSALNSTKSHYGNLLRYDCQYINFYKIKNGKNLWH